MCVGGGSEAGRALTSPDDPCRALRQLIPNLGHRSVQDESKSSHDLVKVEFEKDSDEHAI